jgi:AraC family transcriptional regulator of arabinose operon
LLVAGHFREQHGYAVYRRRGSGNWLITYTLQGQGLYRHATGYLLARPGDLVLLQPGAPQDYSVPPDGWWEFVWAHFHPRVEWTQWWNPPLVGSGLYRYHFSSVAFRERARQAFDHILADGGSTTFTSQEVFHPDNPAQEIFVMAQNTIQRELTLNSLEMVLLLATQEQVRGEFSSLDPRIHDILDILAQGLTVSHDVASLAANVALSPSRLAHLFKEQVGDSITNTSLNLRLRHATRLLEHSSQSIEAIAQQAGFSSASYFSRLFRQRFGMSPRAYRQQLGATDGLAFEDTQGSQMYIKHY